MKGHFMSQLSELLDNYEKEIDETIAHCTEVVKDNLSEASLYEQMAEEASELARACLKKARVLRGENPTPISNRTADIEVLEELTDIHVVSHVLGLKADSRVFWYKTNRWAERIQDAKRQNAHISDA